MDFIVIYINYIVEKIFVVVVANINFKLPIQMSMNVGMEKFDKSALSEYQQQQTNSKKVN